MIIFYSIISIDSFSQQNISQPNQSGKPVPVKGRLTGKITDAKTRAALPGATIYFPDLKKELFPIIMVYILLHSLMQENILYKLLIRVTRPILKL